MKRISRLRRVLAVLAVSCSAVVTAAQASSNDPVLICHGTASDTNPYVVISVDENALAGHFAGHGEDSLPDMFVNADGSCPGEEGGGDE